MRIFFLLVLLVCAVAYVREQQPATWNSWMVAIGANGAVVPAGSDDSNAATLPDIPANAPVVAPVRTVPVGGQIQDGNFSAGNTAWQGDGRPDASGKGLVVTLSPTAWTRVYQTFTSGDTTLYSIEVTYQLSPGLTFSQDPADYTDINKRLQIDGFENYHPMVIPPGNCYGTLGDPASGRIACEVFAPQLRSTHVEDYQHSYPAIAPNGSKTFALAFPPGTGTITLLTAFVNSQ